MTAYEPIAEATTVKISSLFSKHAKRLPDRTEQEGQQGMEQLEQ